MSIQRRGNKKRIFRRKRKKRFKLYLFFIPILLIASIFLIFKFSTYKKNSIHNKPDVVIKDNKSEDKKLKDEKNIKLVSENKVKKLDNSGYLALVDDPNADDVAKTLNETLYKGIFYRKDNKKFAYLTFDDGPSIDGTNKILDILAKNNVKATFFLLGSSIDRYDPSGTSIKRIVKEGHAIGSHGYCHKYNVLYPGGTVDVKTFMDDLDKNDKVLKRVLGKDFSTRTMRMPGGHFSWNGTDALDKELDKKGIYQMDWNALNGDAEGNMFPKEHLVNELKKTVSDKNTVFILMHDAVAKSTTIDALQDSIDYLKSQGYVFRTLK